MCAVSMTIRAAQKQWPPINRWPRPMVSEMSEIIRRLAAIEEKLGIKDCHEPTKDEFLKELAERVTNLEKETKHENMDVV